MSAEGTLPKFVKNYSVVTRSVKQMRIPAGVVKMQSTLSLRSSYANLEWLESAELAHKFKVGDQWSDDEKVKLELQGREGLVWNYIHPAVELVCGVMTQNPTRIYPYPVEATDGFLCQILEDIVTYVDTAQLSHQEDLVDMFEN